MAWCVVSWWVSISEVDWLSDIEGLNSDIHFTHPNARDLPGIWVVSSKGPIDAEFVKDCIPQRALM